MVEKVKAQVWEKRMHKPFSLFGFLLIGIGIFWLLRDLGIIPADIPIWPIVIIAVGLVMVLNRACIKCK